MASALAGERVTPHRLPPGILVSAPATRWDALR